MTFKMKGSPHKMGEIKGTSGHTSALKKKKSPYNQAPERKEEGEYVSGAFKQKLASESTDMNLAGNIRDAEIADAMSADDALIDRFKTSQPKIYEKMMKHYEDNTEGGSWDLGQSQQGSSTYNIQPFDHFLGIKETGIDFLDNKLRQGRERLNKEKSAAVRNKMLDFINETAPESWKSTEEEE